MQFIVLLFLASPPSPAGRPVVVTGLCRQKVFKNLVSKKTRLVLCTSSEPRLHRLFMFPIFYLSFVE